MRYGVKFVVNSGWRSPAYAQQPHDEAVRKYGSDEEAAPLGRPEAVDHDAQWRT
jgi:hypothetical protein